MRITANRHTKLTEGLSRKFLSKEEEQALTREYQRTGDKKIADKLLTTYIYYVVRIGNQYVGYGFDMDDLVQEGSLGLMRALDKFEPDRDVRFITYASWWIKAYMSRYVLKTWSLVCLGSKNAHRVLFFRLRGVEAEFLRTLPSGVDMDAALAKYFKLPVKEVIAMRQYLNQREVSFDEPGVSYSPLPRIERFANDETTPEEKLLQQEAPALLREIVNTLQTLSIKERYVIEKRWLNYRGEQPTLESLGAQLHISRERIRQIQVSAMAKIRAALAEADVVAAC